MIIVKYKTVNHGIIVLNAVTAPPNFPPPYYYVENMVEPYRLTISAEPKQGRDIFKLTLRSESSKLIDVRQANGEEQIIHCFLEMVEFCLRWKLDEMGNSRNL
jgi:hypothetical protein